MLSGKSAGSDRGAASATSATSAFRNQTAADVDDNERRWYEIVKLRNEQARNIDLFKTKVQAVIKSCSIQKNVNMPIKDGPKKIKE